MVEDELIVARDLQMRLNKVGCQVNDIATSKIEAVELAGERRPDLVLMDIRLHGKPEGIEAAPGLVAKIEMAAHKHGIDKYLRDNEDRFRLPQQAGRVGVIDWNLQSEELFLTPELEEILDSGRTIRIVGTVFDITDRKRTKLALREEQKQLERLNADLKDYARTISHDLKEPLRTIRHGLFLVKRGSGSQLDDESQSNLAIVDGNAERMGELINGLLELSHIDNDARPVSDVDCNSVLKEVLASLSAKIEETGARISVGNLPWVCAWRGRLRELFRNLIGNSLKYRKPDVPPQISVSARLCGDTWGFSVKDNGIGFDMSHAEEIFAAFKRLRLGEYEGLGIGLSICKRIVEHQGGSIKAVSVPGEGAEFYFTLPVGPDLDAA